MKVYIVNDLMDGILLVTTRKGYAEARAKEGDCAGFAVIEEHTVKEGQGWLWLRRQLGRTS